MHPAGIGPTTYSHARDRSRQMTDSPTIRVAFGSVPKDGGTFTFYRNIRPELLKHGIDMRCVSVGREDAELWEAAYADDGCHLLVPDVSNAKRQARAFVDWCAEERIDIALGINSFAILSAIPHLPQSVRVMSRCANAFDHGYRITMSGAERLARIVALSPRLRDDLIADYGADPDKLVLIPNGHDPAPFDAAAARVRGTGARLELGFVGRLEHGQKGVLHIPAILAELDALGCDYRLRIAGKGRHGDRLRTELAPHIAAGRVEFLGALGPGEIPDLLGDVDIYLFTSKFEGMPNALIEAMMAGAVPACFNIEGITDFMVDHDRSGLLVPQEDAKALAQGIHRLDQDRDHLRAMSAAVAATARERFSSAGTARVYADLFRAVMAEPAPAWSPKAWSSFTPDPNFPRTWRRFIPKAVKEAIKSRR